MNSRQLIEKKCCIALPPKVTRLSAVPVIGHSAEIFELSEPNLGYDWILPSNCHRHGQDISYGSPAIEDLGS
jgi:hypothetical protein